MNNILHLFVDGSCAYKKIHAGVVAVMNGYIIAENYVKRKSTTQSHEIFAINAGLSLALEIDNIEKVILYSDDRGLVECLNIDSEILKRKNIYKRKKKIFWSFFKLQKKLKAKNIKHEFIFTRDNESPELLRAHNISRKWAESL